MHLRIITMAMLMAASLHLSAQTLEKNYKGLTDGNPISGGVFCADPTALEYNGRLYVYGSNDHQEFIKNGKKGENTYGAIKSIVVFSTDDLVNWTFHGTIDTKKICSGWTSNPWYVGYGVSWAPSVTWRTTEDGTEEFFLYFCNSSHGVGVLKANSPIGPWSSPNKKLMITYDTKGANKQGTNANFDPGVVIDDNGTGWIAFGGLGPGVIQPGAARIIKLKPSMTEVDGTAAKIPAPYHFEANELNYIGGKYVYTYCTNWASNDAEWKTYKSENGITASRPDWCTMCYMVSDDPLNPDSWVYKGAYGPNSTSNNNHSHLQKFQGQYYHLYHGAPLMLSMRSAGILTDKDAYYRSICINKATVNEDAQRINKVTLSTTGPSAIKNLNPYAPQEAETMATCGGVMYEDFKNVKSNTKVSSLNNDASENMYVKMKEGAWTMVRNADFGEEGAKSFTVRVKGTGKLQVRYGKSSRDIKATVEFSSTEWTDYTIDVDPEVFKGKHNLYFVFAEVNNAQFDAWSFSQEIVGDANGDGKVNVADIDFVIELIGADVETHKAANVNNDGEINVADVDYIIERIK
ncbi:MAG: family 43 glycosylhydrolase [Prevotella sp.]|nr:family 43 glycosylhydrolase [Prevotella sp.]